MSELLDALAEFASRPVGPIPLDLSDTLLDHMQGKYCHIVLDYEDRAKLNDAVVEFNNREENKDGKFWLLFSPEIVQAACRYGVTDPAGNKIFDNTEGLKVLALLHPKIGRIFWRQVMSLNGFFPETNKDLVKNSLGTENSNGSSSSVSSSDVPDMNSQLGLVQTTDKSSNSSEPITV